MGPRAQPGAQKSWLASRRSQSAPLPSFQKHSSGRSSPLPLLLRLRTLSPAERASTDIHRSTLCRPARSLAASAGHSPEPTWGLGCSGYGTGAGTSCIAICFFSQRCCLLPSFSCSSPLPLVVGSTASPLPTRRSAQRAAPCFLAIVTTTTSHRPRHFDRARSSENRDRTNRTPASGTPTRSYSTSRSSIQVVFCSCVVCHKSPAPSRQIDSNSVAPNPTTRTSSGNSQISPSSPSYSAQAHQASTVT